MLKDLQEAIFARFNSSAGDTIRGLVLGLWESEAPSSVTLQTQAGEDIENPPLPFITFDVIFTDLQQDFCSNYFTPSIQFAIHGDADNKSSSSLLIIADELIELYGDVLLTVGGGYENIRVDTVNQFKFKDEYKMWNVVIEMDYILQIAR